MPHSFALIVILGLLGTSDEPPAREQPAPQAQPPAAPVVVREIRLGQLDAQAINITVLVGDRTIHLEDRPADPGEEPDQPRRALRLNVSNMILASWNFDEVVFPNAWLPRVRQPHLHYLLDYRIGKVEEKRKLTETERQQLRLAGTGDIQRFMDRVAAARRDFEVARFDYKAGVAELKNLDPLADEFRTGPFSAGSMYAKTLSKIEASTGIVAQDNNSPAGSFRP